MFLKIVRRIAGAVLVLLLASLIAFVVLETSPGDAAQVMVGEAATQEQLDTLRQQMGLDLPLPARYLRYIAKAMQGDFGVSLVSKRPVMEMIGERFSNTLLLALTATSAAMLIGIPLGMAAAARRGSWLDLLLMSGMALGVSIPTFVVAMLFTGIFAVWLGWLPVVGGGTAAHLVLPALTMTIPMLAMVARLTRSSLLDVADEAYVLTARAKGALPPRVWRKHILKNGMIPVVTMIGLHFGHLLGGAFVIETIFGWPGLGRMIVQAVFDQDYPVILGAVLLLAVVFQLFNLLVDLLHGVLDPRVAGEAV